jgi:hypothetical protein
MTRISDIAPRKTNSRKTKSRLAKKAQRLAEYEKAHPRHTRKRR